MFLCGSDNCRTPVPYTHLYEDILLNDKYRHDAGTKELSELKLRIKEYLKNETSKSSNKGFDKVTKLLMDLNIDHILTTNYEYGLKLVKRYKLHLIDKIDLNRLK